jgi:hypothetical protein
MTEYFEAQNRYQVALENVRTLRQAQRDNLIMQRRITRALTAARIERAEARREVERLYDARR